MGTQGCRQSKGAMNVRKHCVGGKMREGRRGGGDRGEEGRRGEMEGRRGEVESRMREEEGGRR